MIETRQDLVALQTTASKGLLILIWLHPPILAIMAALLGHAWLLTEGIAIGLGATATVCWVFSPNSLESRLTIAVAFVGMVSLVVQQLDGNAWQIDSHMYFFAALAVLAAFCDWRVLLAAATAIALHHLILNFVLPAAIYPGGADFGRVLLHAVIVILETGALVWLTHKLTVLFAVSHAALDEAAKAQAAEVAAHAREAAGRTDVEAAKRDAQRVLSQRFEAEVGELVREVATAAAGVHSNAESLSGTASRTSESTTRIVEASRTTGACMETMTTATRELSTSVSAISDQIARATTMSHEAARQSNETTETMSRLAAMTGRIETVVQLINGIAGQTNLLALNATIEAARAAEAGKGFAVVANEVKALATETAKATGDIRGQIAAIQTETEHAVSAIGGIAQTIADLGGITTAIAAAVQEQATATEAITRSAQQAADGAEAISSELTTLARAANDTGTAADAGREASGHLSADCSKMTDRVHVFLSNLLAS
jgi:methyl-accepting chemotaxis protein